MYLYSTVQQIIKARTSESILKTMRAKGYNNTEHVGCIFRNNSHCFPDTVLPLVTE